MLKKMVMTTLAMGALYIPGMASAEEAAAPQEFALDEVVVTANRMENKLVDTPANVAVVTAEEIERRNYQDAIEAVKNVPGVNVLEGFSGDDHMITIGGSDRVLVLVNGRRVGSDQGFSSSKGKLDASMLPNAAAIEKIEVLKGGGATVYGADAVGGVINIITKKANENQIKLNVNTGSWGTQNYKAFISAKEGKTGIVVSASKEKQNYMKFKEANTKSHQKMPNSASDKVSLDLQIEQEIGNNQSLALYYDHLNKKGGRPGTAQYQNTDKGHKIDNNVALRYSWNTDLTNSGYAQVYRNNSVNDWSKQMKTDENKTGFDVQQTIKTGNNNTLVVGASYYKSDVDTDGNMTKYNKSFNNKAIFVQDSWDFAPSWKLNTGMRYDKHNYAGSKTTGSVAVNKKFNESSHAFISWSQIFNAPTTDDLFYFYQDSSKPSWSSYGNENLKPEKGDIWTVGYETKVGRKSQVSTDVFYSEVKDAINWNFRDGKYGSGSYCDNIDKQKRRGFELSYKYSFDDNWSLNASYAYVKVEDKSGNGDYARDYNVLPNQYKLGVSYNSDKWDVDFYGRGASGGIKGEYVSYYDGLTYGKYADSKYLSLDLSINYKVKENWKVYAKGYNLTNAAYTETAGTFDVTNGNNVQTYSRPAAGRRFVIGTEVTF